LGGRGLRDGTHAVVGDEPLPGLAGEAKARWCLGRADRDCERVSGTRWCRRCLQAQDVIDDMTGLLELVCDPVDVDG
jgi:hypothetical protein